MVSNTKGYSVADWESEINLARNAKLDGFALNMGRAESTNGDSFKLFFSLDYAGNGPWLEKDATDIINKFKNNGAYFKHNGKPLVSTFEGPASAAEWDRIKPATGAFFIPSYSSLGAKEAAKINAVDGLFSWAA
ncbi:hypothetical protein ACHAQH_001170 [Verticillium albo-atrum]